MAIPLIGPLLEEWHGASPKKKVIIAVAVVGIAGLAWYLHSKSSGSASPVRGAGAGGGLTGGGAGGSTPSTTVPGSTVPSTDVGAGTSGGSTDTSGGTSSDGSSGSGTGGGGGGLTAGELLATGKKPTQAPPPAAQGGKAMRISPVTWYSYPTYSTSTTGALYAAGIRGTRPQWTNPAYTSNVYMQSGLIAAGQKPTSPVVAAPQISPALNIQPTTLATVYGGRRPGPTVQRIAPVGNFNAGGVAPPSVHNQILASRLGR